MALPNPGMDAVPFTPLTAEFLDDMIENIESLSDGTGFENGAITANAIDFSTFGNVVMPNAGANSTSVTTTVRSLIWAYAGARIASPTVNAYRITFNTSNGTILKQVSTASANDQIYRYIAATGYALVGPGTYTVTRASSGGITDQDSIVAVALPVPMGL